MANRTVCESEILRSWMWQNNNINNNNNSSKKIIVAIREGKFITAKSDTNEWYQKMLSPSVSAVITNTIDVWLKWQTFISHSSGGQKSEIRVLVWSGSWWGPSFWLCPPMAFPWYMHADRGRSCVSLFMLRALITSWELHPHDLI